MKRVLSLTALSLVLLLPSSLFSMLHPVHNRFLQRDPLGYPDGMSCYEYTSSKPAQCVDPEGTREVTLDRDIPAECAECSCVGDKHDCTISVEWLQEGDVVNILYTHPETRVRMRHERPFLMASLTSDDGGTSIFWEHVGAIIRVESKSGKDVRKCHLRQDVVDGWAQQVDGARVDFEAKEKDYASDVSKDNKYYGGWWILDMPGFQITRDQQHRGEVYKRVWRQFRVFVEENSKVEMYWGFSAEADFSVPGKRDIPVEKSPFGPEAKRRSNPFVEAKP